MDKERIGVIGKAIHPDFDGKIGLSVCPLCGHASLDTWSNDGSGGYSSGCGGGALYNGASMHPSTKMVRFIAERMPERPGTIYNG